jgi:hypothetical protein
MTRFDSRLFMTRELQIDEHLLFSHVSEIIENRKYRAVTHTNQETTIMFWEVGQHINSVVLGNNVPLMVKRFCRRWRQN